MDYSKFIELSGAVGTGVIIAKLLDILFLQKIIYNNERNKWNRDKKIEIYSRIATDLLTQKEWGSNKKTQELLSLIGEVFLIIECDELAKKIDNFYNNTKVSLRKSDGMYQTARNNSDELLLKEADSFHKTENARFQQEAFEIVTLLRQDLLK